MCNIVESNNTVRKYHKSTFTKYEPFWMGEWPGQLEAKMKSSRFYTLDFVIDRMLPMSTQL